MKILLFLALMMSSAAGFADTEKDLAAIISLQQAELTRLKEALQATNAALTNLSSNVYSKTEADSRFVNQSQTANFYTKVEADSRYLLQSQASNFMSASERLSLQHKVTAYMANCSWNDSTRVYTCSCNGSDLAVSAGAQAWGSDSIKELFPLNMSTWQVSCIDHDKKWPDEMNKCARWSQVMCLRI